MSVTRKWLIKWYTKKEVGLLLLSNTMLHCVPVNHPAGLPIKKYKEDLVINNIYAVSTLNFFNFCVLCERLYSNIYP